jgi:hypothetical protein
MSWIGDLKDLLNFRQERKKRGLELEKLEGEARRIRVATDEEIVKHDPKRRKLDRAIETDWHSGGVPRTKSLIMILVALLLFAIFLSRNC